MNKKVFVYDINVQEMSGDQEARLRCAARNLNEHAKVRCKILCHNDCIGCDKANSSTSCTECRYDGIYDEKGGAFTCLQTCPRGFEKNLKLQKCQGLPFIMKIKYILLKEP